MCSIKEIKKVNEVYKEELKAIKKNNKELKEENIFLKEWIIPQLKEEIWKYKR